MTIVCHKHRFIFIKTRKTAGSSIEIALSRLCEDSDFITPLSHPEGPDERLRREAGGHPPVNWQKSWWQYRSWKEIRQRFKRGRRAMLLGAHATAGQIRHHFGEDVWNRYLKITVERNPWDKAVSRYWWMRYRSHRRHGGAKTFESLSDFLERVSWERPHWLSNWNHYAINDRPAVDCFLFYETLSADLQALEQRLKVPAGTLTLPRERAKGNSRADCRPYTEVMGRSDRSIVSAICRKEITELGYRFETTASNAPRVLPS